MAIDRSKWHSVTWPRGLPEEVDKKVWDFLGRYCGYYDIPAYSNEILFLHEETAVAFKLTFGFDKPNPHLNYPFARYYG